MFFRKIFGVIQETFGALLKKDFVYLRQDFVHFLKKDWAFSAERLCVIEKSLSINKKDAFLCD